ncbi:MAG: N-acetylneuraminate synthase [Clostridiaceae bacterium]
MKRTFIIAEAGVNHNGDIENAKKLVDIAFEAGADAVKFQTFITENLVTKNAVKAKYQEQNTGNGYQYEMLKNLELSFDDHTILKKYCDEKGILFMSTPFDFESVDLLEKLNISIYKIASGDLTNIPLLEYISKLNKPIIISTGMSNLREIEIALEAISGGSNNKISLLHCTSNYPTNYKEVNLNAMVTLKNAFKLSVGYSDHTEGVEIPIAAVAMGAEIIEKHFTLDKNLKGPDHKASLNSLELKSMIKSIRNLEQAFGDGIKRCNDSEKIIKSVGRKSIVAKTDINMGDSINSENITIKRPEGGIPPEYFKKIIGKKALCNIKKDSFIKWTFLE